MYTQDDIELALVEFGINPIQAEFLARVASSKTAQAIVREQDRQIAKWGEQNHPSFSAKFLTPDALSAALAARDQMRDACDEAFKEGAGCWQWIFAEEFFEAIAERVDPEALKVELVQVAAVAASWIESIERAGDLTLKVVSEDETTEV